MPVRQLCIGLLPGFIVGLLQQGPGRLLRVVQQFISLSVCPGQQGIGLAAVAQSLAGDQGLGQPAGAGPQFKGAT